MADIKLQKDQLLLLICEYVDWPALCRDWHGAISQLKSLEDRWGQPVSVFRAVAVALDRFEAILMQSIVVIEKISKDVPGLKGAKKDALVKILDDIIQLPGVFELFDSHLIGMVIDQVVSQMNRVFGHDWSEKLAGIAKIDDPILVK
jgi:hypothetical protein